MESSKLLYDSLEPIVQDELYRQGYLDRVKLLVTLGLLAGETGPAKHRIPR